MSRPNGRGRAWRLTPERLRREVLAEALLGTSMRLISSRTGVPRASVSRIVKRAGLTLRRGLAGIVPASDLPALRARRVAPQGDQ